MNSLTLVATFEHAPSQLRGSSCIVPKYARNTQVHSLFHHSYNPIGWQTDTTGERSGAGPTIVRAPPTARII